MVAERELLHCVVQVTLNLVRPGAACRRERRAGQSWVYFELHVEGPTADSVRECCILLLVSDLISATKFAGGCVVFVLSCA